MKKMFFLFFLVLLAAAPGLGDDLKSDGMSFDKNVNYNIYFNEGDDVTFVIDDVEIIGIKEIFDKRFLVVKSRGLKLSPEEGIVLFDSIVAILPERNFKVRKISDGEIKYKAYSSGQ